MNDPSPQHPRVSFPLSALFLLTAAAGVLVSLLAPVVRGVLRGTVEAGYVLLASAIGAMLLTLLGAVLGAAQENRVAGTTHGMIVGWVLGGVLGPLVLTPSSSFNASLVGAIGGAVILVGIAGIIYLASRK